MNTDRMPRCPACGRRSMQDQTCTECGYVGAVALQNARPVPPGILEAPVRARPVVVRQTAPLLQQAGPPDGEPPLTAILRIFGMVEASQEVTGRVIWVQSGQPEPMDPDPWRAPVILIWGIILFVSPLIGAALAMVASGFIAAVVVFLVLLWLLRFIFSHRLLESWTFTAALQGRHVVEPMPVTHMRLRDTTGQELEVRTKGMTEGGNINQGDRVEVSGTWRNGLLLAREIRCAQTAVTIRPRQPRALPWAMAGAAVLCLAALWMSNVAVPTLTHRFRSFGPRFAPDGQVEIPDAPEFRRDSRRSSEFLQIR